MLPYHQDKGHGPRQEDVAKKLILLVEDDMINVSLLVQVIEEETCHQVAYTTDGKTAWKFLQHIRPQLVILDYRLPGLDGLQLYDRIRGSKHLYGVPILMLSAVLPVDEVERRGIVSLKKPFDLNKLLDVIDALLVS
jgi:DNA-binding response OmpR family regulator